MSLATQADLTLFFDFVPLEPAAVAGMRPRIQVYTVPGRVFYETTRRMVLEGCDAVVFVADSQASMLDANVESLRGLRQNLLANDLDPALPQVIQYNKRDLATALPLALLEAQLNPRGLPRYEAVAVEGVGVQETLGGITSLVFERLARPVRGDRSAPGRRLRRPRSPPRAPAPRRTGSPPSPPRRSPRAARPRRGPRRRRTAAGRPRPGAGRSGSTSRTDANEGPVTLDELVDLVLGSIPEDTKVWRPGLAGWVSANRVGVIADEIPPEVPRSAAPLRSPADDDMPDFDSVPPMFRAALIADEDAVFRRYLAMPLAAQGFTIYEAGDGAAAWQIAVQHRPWIILADLSMPELDGFEFCRRVRSHPLLARTPLVFISGSDKYRERHRALQIGADDFLSKTTPIRELLIRMQLLMTRYSDLGTPHRPDEERAASTVGALEGQRRGVRRADARPDLQPGTPHGCPERERGGRRAGRRGARLPRRGDRLGARRRPHPDRGGLRVPGLATRAASTSCPAIPARARRSHRPSSCCSKAAGGSRSPQAEVDPAGRPARRSECGAGPTGRQRIQTKRISATVGGREQKTKRHSEGLAGGVSFRLATADRLSRPRSATAGRREGRWCHARGERPYVHRRVPRRRRCRSHSCTSCSPAGTTVTPTPIQSRSASSPAIS